MINEPNDIEPKWYLNVPLIAERIGMGCSPLEKYQLHVPYDIINYVKWLKKLPVHASTKPTKNNSMT